jgi:hypothetical protein
LDAVVQYLRLRYEAMSGFRYQRSTLLTEAYEAFQLAGELDEVLRRRVAGAMRSAAEQNTVFSERNIKHCIGFHYWLAAAIEHTAIDRREFWRLWLENCIADGADSQPDRGNQQVVRQCASPSPRISASRCADF